MDPIGPFEHLPFDAWEEGVQVNCLRQLRVLHELLPYRRRNANRPSVLFFAAGGTNGPAVNYSGYTISKIMLLKMCEFLDAEIPDTRFVIVGPGWVKTKIHESTLRAGSNAGGNWQRTQERLAGGEWVSMDQVVDCCTWLVSTDSKGVDGRNFSVAHDAYGSKVLERALEQNPDMYKLRRYNNSWRASGGSYPTN
jgi:NAD(P)-dependent dehydrogenase (short-subunit alcohol dehydrogenase family)